MVQLTQWRHELPIRRTAAAATTTAAGTTAAITTTMNIAKFITKSTKVMTGRTIMPRS